MHIIIHNGRGGGGIRNKYRPVTAFVRVVSVGACPTPLTVDTPVRFIPFQKQKHTMVLRNARASSFFYTYCLLTRIIQSLYYAPAGRYINAWMHSLKKSVKPEIVNRYDLWVLRHKIGGAKVFVNNVQWSDQMM